MNVPILTFKRQKWILKEISWKIINGLMLQMDKTKEGGNFATNKLHGAFENYYYKLTDNKNKM